MVVISFPKVGRFVKEVHEEEGGFGYREISPVVEVRSPDTVLRSSCLETDIGHGEIYMDVKDAKTHCVPESFVLGIDNSHMKPIVIFSPMINFLLPKIMRGFHLSVLWIHCH